MGMLGELQPAHAAGAAGDKQQRSNCIRQLHLQLLSYRWSSVSAAAASDNVVAAQYMLLQVCCRCGDTACLRGLNVSRNAPHWRRDGQQKDARRIAVAQQLFVQRKPMMLWLSMLAGLAGTDPTAACSISTSWQQY
jgi:hypothetical protein